MVIFVMIKVTIKLLKIFLVFFMMERGEMDAGAGDNRRSVYYSGSSALCDRGGSRNYGCYFFGGAEMGLYTGAGAGTGGA